MFKTAIKQGPLLFCCILISFFFAIIQAPTVHAATRQTRADQQASITLSVPGQTNLIGHPGTLVSISLAKFMPKSNVTLYTTTDSNQCTANGNGELLPFSVNPPVKTDGTGSYANNGIPWPTNANTPATLYYVCAVGTDTAGNPTSAVTTLQDSFTVAQQATFTFSPQTVQAGNQITITGSNWPPNQALTIQIVANGQLNTQLGPSPHSDFNGNLNAPVTIPSTTAPGTYTVIVSVTNQQGGSVQQDNMLTVTATTPTPTPSPSPTSSPTASPTATVTPTTSDSNGGGGFGLTILIFTLGGLGVLLIVIGVVMLAASSPPAQAR